MQQVLAAGVKPRIDVTVFGSMAMPFFLRGSDRVAVMGRWLITELGDAMGIREIAGPFELESLTTAFWWHPSRRDDPSHAWLRGLISEVGTGRQEAGSVPSATDRPLSATERLDSSEPSQHDG